jgi:anhydro-N-acetylmuramic acid kinase
MKIIGLMSGTSADGVDAALVEWPDGAAAQPFELVAFTETPHGGLQERIHRLAAGGLPGPDLLAEYAALDVLLGERFADAAIEVAARAGVALSDVAAIASHGQTVAHHPEHRATLQIGDPSVIAERTGCDVVADFRARDLAAGGEGAPLAPFFHWQVMGSPSEARGVLNLGGIANLSYLPAAASAEQVVAFDTGPASALIDEAVRIFTDGRERMDRGGERARRGRVDDSLLASLLSDPYLERRPPKSTGREYYGRAQAEALVRDWQRAGKREDDLVATLTAFTIESVAGACRQLLGSGAAPIERLLVGGGGAANGVLMEGIGAALPGAQVEPFDAVGVPAAAAEAMAFSLMGRNALLGLPNHLPRTTGATHARVLGEIVRA